MCSVPFCSSVSRLGKLWPFFLVPQKPGYGTWLLPSPSIISSVSRSPCGFADPFPFRVYETLKVQVLLFFAPKPGYRTCTFLPYPIFTSSDDAPFLSPSLLTCSPCSVCADSNSSLGYHTRVAQVLPCPLGPMNAHCTATSIRCCLCSK